MLIQRQTHGCRLLVQKVGKAIKPHFKADSLTFAVQVRSAAQCYSHLQLDTASLHCIPIWLNPEQLLSTLAAHSQCLLDES